MLKIKQLILMFFSDIGMYFDIEKQHQKRNEKLKTKSLYNFIE